LVSAENKWKPQVRDSCDGHINILENYGNWNCSWKSTVAILKLREFIVECWNKFPPKKSQCRSPFSSKYKIIQKRSLQCTRIFFKKMKEWTRIEIEFFEVVCYSWISKEGNIYQKRAGKLSSFWNPTVLKKPRKNEKFPKKI
jgi:hypothetical protein